MPNKNDALSRVENILESMLGKAELEVTAQSRVETLLIELKEAIEDGGTGGDTTALAARIAECERDISTLESADTSLTTALGELRAILSDANDDINDLHDNKVDKVSGKGLSTEDYTTAEKTKLASLENYDDTNIRNDISALQSGKQAALTTTQLAAVNSNITEDKVEQYDDTVILEAEDRAALAEIIDSGAKNRIINNQVDTTISGVAVTINSDKSITLNGTNSSESNTLLIHDFAVRNAYTSTEGRHKPLISGASYFYQRD